MTSRAHQDWTDQLDRQGVVELTAGDQVVARVDHDGVHLPSEDLLVPWRALAFAFGHRTRHWGVERGELELTVSRTWWTQTLGRSRAQGRPAPYRDNGWEASLAVGYERFGRRRIPVDDFAEWLEDQAVRRAPLPDRLCLTPHADRPVLDRDSNRDVPLDRLPLSHQLRADIEAWGALGDDVPSEGRSDDATWEPLWASGRALAARVEEETGRRTAVWADCPEVP